MERRLLPCPNPFQQHTGLPFYVEYRYTEDGWWRIGCRECGLETPAQETQKGAEYLWNTAPRKD